MTAAETPSITLGFKNNPSADAGGLGDHFEICPTLGTDCGAHLSVCRNETETVGERPASAPLPSDRRNIAFSFDSLASNSMKSANPHSGHHVTEVSKTLDTTSPDPIKNQGGIAILAFTQNQRDQVRIIGGHGQVSGALAAQPGMKQTTFVVQGGTPPSRAATMRLRAGRPGGGKGALISVERALTVACGNDQTLFVVPTDDCRDITRNRLRERR